jgi:excisionase family DNA binding protein
MTLTTGGQGDNGSLRSPWLTLREAAIYLKRGRRFVRRQITEGRLRGARVGGRGEVLTRAEWCDQWVEDQAAPVAVPFRKRG